MHWPTCFFAQELMTCHLIDDTDIHPRALSVIDELTI